MDLLNPQETITKVIIGAVALGLTAVFGMIGGCEYKQREWDKDKLAASEAARKLEKSDHIAGHRKVEQFGEDKITISQAKDWVKNEVEKAPKKLVSCGKVEVVTTATKVESEKKDETIKVEYLPTFTVDFMQLYDVSVDPSNVGLRAGTYGTPAEASIDEGSQIIRENNFRFNSEVDKLKRLQERICEKQKLYEQPVSEFCH